MVTINKPAIVLIAALCSYAGLASATPLQDCASSSAPTVCLDAKLKEAAKQLNATLKAAQDRLEQLQAHGRRPVMGAFIDSQRKFNAYRDAQCNWQGVRAPSGANSSDYVKDCQIRATLAREQELAEFLADENESYAAPPAPSPAPVEPESQVAKNAEPASSEGQIADTEPQVTQLPTEPTERSPGSAEPSGTGARANEWRLIKWIAHGAERSVVPDSIVSIAFDPSGKISGNASVNRYSGTFSFDVDGHLKWPPSGFRVTRMAGDPALMAQERAFLDSLRRTSLYKTDGQQLILESANASVVLTFTR